MSDLLELAVRTHGSFERPREIRNIKARVSLRGVLYRIMGFPAGIPRCHAEYRRPPAGRHDQPIHPSRSPQLLRARRRRKGMVDAVLAGLDQGEVVTIPNLHEGDEWTRFEAARRALAKQFGNSVPALRDHNGELFIVP